MTTITIRPTSENSPSGRGYVAVVNDRVIASHYCSNDSFAKNDLGMYPENEAMYDSKAFAKQRRDVYASMYPNGFTVTFSDEIFHEPKTYTEKEILHAFAQALGVPDAGGWSTGVQILNNLRNL